MVEFHIRPCLFDNLPTGYRGTTVPVVNAVKSLFSRLENLALVLKVRSCSLKYLNVTYTEKNVLLIRSFCLYA